MHLPRLCISDTQPQVMVFVVSLSCDSLEDVWILSTLLVVIQPVSASKGCRRNGIFHGKREVIILDNSFPYGAVLTPFSINIPQRLWVE